MNKLLPLALLSVSALAAAAGYRMDSYAVLDGKTLPVYAWCDASDRILVVGQPDRQRTAENSIPVPLAQWTKKNPTQPTVQQYLLGPSEGAAGSIYDALIPPGRTPNSDSASQYYLRTSNVENVLDPAYRMTHVVNVKLPAGDFQCRYVPQAAFMGVTKKRTVIVWDNGQTATYATRNFDGTPGVYVTGGKPIDFGTETGWGYEFTTKDGYKYVVGQGDFVPNPHMRLDVYKADKNVLYEPFVAYSISRPAP